MPKVIKRIWDVIVGLAMLAVAVVIQGIMLLLLSWAVLGVADLAGATLSNAVFYGIVIAMLVVFNVVAFWVYLRRLHRAGFDKGDRMITGIGGPKTTSATCVIFLVPRAVMRILIGRERRVEAAKGAETPAEPAGSRSQAGSVGHDAWSTKGPGHGSD